MQDSNLLALSGAILSNCSTVELSIRKGIRTLNTFGVDFNVELRHVELFCSAYNAMKLLKLTSGQPPIVNQHCKG